MLSTLRCDRQRFVRLPAAVLLPAALATSLAAGCAARYNVRPTDPTRAAVLAAVSEVIQERYPMSRTHTTDGYVLAVTPAKLEGATRTKRSISVMVEQNYTGAYEPFVRVRHDVDVATPIVGEVSSTNPVKASPFGRERWRPMGHLELEEDALATAILSRIEGMGS